MTIGRSTSVDGALLGGTETVAFNATIPEGSLLYLVYAGHGFGAPPQAGTLTSVSDDVNGVWTIEHNSGNQNDGANHNWSGAAAVFTGSAAAPHGLNVTIVSTVGQSVASFVLTTFPGVARQSPLSFEIFDDTTASAGDGSITTPQTAPAFPGGLALTWLAGYSGGAIANPLTESVFGWTLLGSRAASDAAIAVAYRPATTTSDEQIKNTFGGYFVSATAAVTASIVIFDDSVINLYLRSDNRAIVITAGDKNPLPPQVDVTGLIVFSVPAAAWAAAYQPAFQDALSRNVDLAVFDDFTFADVAHILTPIEEDAVTLSGYLANGSPTASDTVTALKALITEAKVDKTPPGDPMWRAWADATGRLRLGQYIYADGPGRVSLAIPIGAWADGPGRVNLAIPTDAWADAAGRCSLI